ncbi:MAG: hypothetical protein ACKOW2_09580 [Sphingobacteriaceae bacterium]
MKQLYFYLIFIFLLVFSHITQAQDLPKIKKAMVLAVESEEITDSLYKKLTALNSDDPLIWAYIATLDGLKAKHAWNPYLKLKYVNRSQKLIGRAVAAEPDDLEIRFMRFSLQHYTPAFLGFSKDLEEDKRVILHLFELKKFGHSDADLVRNIAKFMLDTNRCTPGEVQLLKKFV